MDTSKHQLINRYRPIQPLSRSGNVWTFASESSDTKYTTTRDGSKYVCTCPAKGLCKHIQSAILEDGKAKFGIVQVWTSEQDAKRQRRQMFRIKANRKLAWVTVGAKRDRVAELDAEIARVGHVYKDAEHAKLMTNDANKRAAAQKQQDQAYQQLRTLQKAREREVVKRMMAA